MTANTKPIATKRLMNIEVGDRICYNSGDLLINTYTNNFVPLSGDVLSITPLPEGRIQLKTSSGLLRGFLPTVEFEIVASDYEGIGTQRAYDVKPAEVFAGRSIE